MSYAWWPYMRFTPANGVLEEWDLRSKFSDLNGPVRVGLDYVPDRERRVTAEKRKLGLLHRGFRPRVDLEIEIFTLAHQANMAAIINRLRRPANWLVELSLDGGITYRAVQIESHDGPTPLGGKTCIGARHRLRVDAVDLLADIPSMDADPETARDLLFDGGFDEWSDTTTPVHWLEDDSGGWGSLNRAGINAVSGAAMRVDKATGTSSNPVAAFQAHSGLVPGKYYRARAYVRCSPAGSTAEIMLVKNDGGLSYFNRATMAWQGSHPGAANLIAGTTTYTEHSFLALWPSNFDATWALLVMFVHWGAVGDQIFYDEARVYGPVRPPGIAAW